jgi:hypothetical protein
LTLLKSNRPIARTNGRYGIVCRSFENRLYRSHRCRTDSSTGLPLDGGGPETEHDPEQGERQAQQSGRSPPRWGRPLNHSKDKDGFTARLNVRRARHTLVGNTDRIDVTHAREQRAFFRRFRGGYEELLAVFASPELSIRLGFTRVGVWPLEPNVTGSNAVNSTRNVVNYRPNSRGLGTSLIHLASESPADDNHGRATIGQHPVRLEAA